MKYIALIEIHLGMYWMPDFHKLYFGLSWGLELKCAAYFPQQSENLASRDAPIYDLFVSELFS